VRKILLVEDEEVLRDTYLLILSTEPYDVRAAADGGEALQLCKQIDFDLILLDLMMPRIDGLAFLEKYKELHMPASNVVIMSNLSSGDSLSQAISLGAYKNVVKAEMSPRELLSMVRYELQSS
jgi:DNA-binding response OmpR family regulator